MKAVLYTGALILGGLGVASLLGAAQRLLGGSVGGLAGGQVLMGLMFLVLAIKAVKRARDI